MKTVTFDIEIANAVENAVCEVFDCRVSEIVSLKDTLVKKVVVFILLEYCGCDKRVSGYYYQMSYLYVPTVVAEMKYLIKTVPAFEAKIKNVYEKILDC